MTKEEIEAEIESIEKQFQDVIMSSAKLKNETGFLYGVDASEAIRAFSDYIFDLRRCAREGVRVCAGTKSEPHSKESGFLDLWGLTKPNQKLKPRAWD